MPQHGGKRIRWLCLFALAWLTGLTIAVWRIDEKQDIQGIGMDNMQTAVKTSIASLNTATATMQLFMAVGGCGPVFPPGTTRDAP